jgi:methionyl-tRNA formyltransferase
LLRAESGRFAAAIDRTEAGAVVPSCPGWTRDDLLWHLTRVQWFWGTLVHERITDAAQVAALDLPRLGCVNLHASLLPRWRGAAPIQRAILAGDRETGITLMQMAAGLDTGPMLLRRPCPIGFAETAGELHDRLARLAAEVLAEALPDLAAGRLSAEPQPAEGVTYAAKLEKTEAWIDWQQAAVAIDRQIRAFNPWPVAQTRLGEEVLRIWRARPDPDMIETAIPGTVVQADRDGVAVATGAGRLWLEQIQFPGGRPLAASELAHGRTLRGVRLGY